MITQIMPSAKQIKARKAFVKKYAKKGKRSKSKFQRTGKKRDMVEGTDYITGKGFSKLLRDANKPKSKRLSQKLKKEMRY